MAPPITSTLMDVSPKQLVSVAAALIPFLENDDANRALMGSNMQRQAVPLVRPRRRSSAPAWKRPWPATPAPRSPPPRGIVDQVDATRIVIRATGDVEPGQSGVDIYTLLKFQRSNQNTCINQRPLVKVGDVVPSRRHHRRRSVDRAGRTGAGPQRARRVHAVERLQLRGLDPDLRAHRARRRVHLDPHRGVRGHGPRHQAGPEEITRDIPNVGEEALRNLDEAGIVYIGAEVQPGDILVGKVTPKGESPMTPEEKLLRAIFGEKASDVRDTSLRLPPGVAGTIVEVRVFNRHGVDKDERAMAIEREEIERLAKDRDDEGDPGARFYGRLQGHADRPGRRRAPRASRRAPKITEPCWASRAGEWCQIAVPTTRPWPSSKPEGAVRRRRQAISEEVRGQGREAAARRRAAAGRDEDGQGLRRGEAQAAAGRQDGRPSRQQGRHLAHPADRRHAVPGGRHPVDIVLNPLGVPSRMNVGQISKPIWAGPRAASASRSATRSRMARGQSQPGGRCAQR
jgi:DNA-directed RNA polymerase subunit beta